MLHGDRAVRNLDDDRRTQMLVNMKTTQRKVALGFLYIAVFCRSTT